MRKALRCFLFLAVLSLLPLAVKAQSLPCPTGQDCGGSVTFTVTFQAPTTPASVSPSSAVAGSGQATLTLTAASGSTFNSTMTVQWCEITPTPCTTSTALTTTFVSTTTLTAVVPAAQLASSGTFAVYLSQPSGGHAQNVGPMEILAISDSPICTECQRMRGEILTTRDNLAAIKG